MKEGRKEDGGRKVHEGGKMAEGGKEDGEKEVYEGRKI
jgi:hypothetical protein